MFDMQGSVVFQLDTALKSSDLEQAKKLIKENPELQAHINGKLYTLGKAGEFFLTKLTGPELREMRKLLAIGAEPDYRTDSKKNVTLLEQAVLIGDLPLTKMLLEQGANPLRDPLETLADLTVEANKNAMDYQGHRLPIQRAYEKFMKNCFDKINNEIFNLLSEALLKTHEKEIEEQFRGVFQHVINEIKKAKASANREDKRLMILIGENHEGLNSFVIESMAYLVAKELGINNVLTEQDQKMLDHFNNTGKRLTRANQWGAIINFLDIVKKNKGEIIPIDIEQTELSGKEAERRNKTMSQCANQVKSDVVCVVGDGHLYGLLRETDLESNFYVLPISTTIADYKKIQQLKKSTIAPEEFDKQPFEVKSLEFNAAFPEKIKNFTAFQDAEYQTLMSPDKATAIVYKVFEELKPSLDVMKQEKKSDSPRQ